MRSEMQVQGEDLASAPVPGQTWARLTERLGAVFTASMSVLFVEGVIGTIGLFVWGQTQESPGLGLNAMNLFLLLMMVPFAAVIGAVLGLLLTFAVVMPLVVLAGWLGREISGREDWWWIPALAAAGGTVPAVVAAAVVEAGPLGSLVTGVIWWFVVTVAIAAPALVVQRLLTPDRRWLSGGAMFGWLCLYGTLAVVAAGVLAASALNAGIGYEPPRLDAERIAGVWSDGEGGTLTLTADGRATADHVDTYDVDAEAKDCTGTGTWDHDPGTGPWSQQVEVTVEGCPYMSTWEVLGTDEHPKLYVYVGDPDALDLYILERAYRVEAG